MPYLKRSALLKRARRINELIGKENPPKKKHDRVGRWLSPAERQGVIELSIYPITRHRVEYLYREIKRLHGFGKDKRSDPQINFLRDQYNKERRKLSELRDEYFRFKSNAMSPYQVAKHFNTSARVIYRIWSRYIKIGTTIFCSDINRQLENVPTDGTATNSRNNVLNLERRTKDEVQNGSAPDDGYFRTEISEDAPPLYYFDQKKREEKALRAKRQKRIDAFNWIHETRIHFDSLFASFQAA